MEILWKSKLSAKFWANHSKVGENCAFPQNAHTKKLGENSVFCAVNTAIKMMVTGAQHCRSFKLDSTLQAQQRVVHVETTWKRPLPLRFNVECTWYVCSKVEVLQLRLAVPVVSQRIRVLRIRLIYQTLWPSELGNGITCKMFAVQTLLWSLEVVIYQNVEHGTFLLKQQLSLRKTCHSVGFL